MTNIMTTYNLNNIKQLIDLNKDKINFELEFQIESVDGKTFEALVVTQEMLDSEEPIIYQKAEGFISGKIVSDKNIYQNYFLLLKSSEPVECKVLVNIKDIPPNIDNFRQQMPREEILNQKIKPIIKKSAKKSWFTMKNLIFLGLIMLAIFLIWYFYFKSPSSQEVKNDTSLNDVSSSLLLNTEELSSKISDDISNRLQNKLSEEITEKFSEINNGISEKVSNINDNLNIKVDGLGSKLSENLNSKVDGLGSTLSDNLNSKVDGLGSKLSENISSKVDGLGSKLTENIGSKVDGLSTKIVGDISSSVNGLNNKMTELKDGITDGITSKFSTNMEGIKNQLETIKLQAKNDAGNFSKNESVLKKIKDFKIKE